MPRTSRLRGGLVAVIVSTTLAAAIAATAGAVTSTSNTESVNRGAQNASHYNLHANGQFVAKKGTAKISSVSAVRQANLRVGMRTLWSQHMAWTYATVNAFVYDNANFDATVQRLMKNQQDIGNAIKPYYGARAGNQLTALLKEHINGAVPVLIAAKAGNTADLNTAVAAWNKNADQIAAFLAKANPNLPAAELKKMMRMHISQTVTYAADLLQGKHAKAITDYGKAEHHMLMMSDALTTAIIKQFPKRF